MNKKCVNIAGSNRKKGGNNMLIIKRSSSILQWKTFKENFELQKGDKFSITYSSYSRDIPEKDQLIEPLETITIGDDVRHLKENIKWLNENKLTAVIHCVRADSDINIEQFPIFTSKKRKSCIFFEGFHREEFQDMVARLQEITSGVKDINAPYLKWMLEDGSNNNDVIITLTNKSEVDTIHNWSRYNNDNILYCQFGRPTKAHVGAPVVETETEEGMLHRMFGLRGEYY